MTEAAATARFFGQARRDAAGRSGRRHEEHEGPRGREPRPADLRVQLLRDARAQESRRRARRAARLPRARRRAAVGLARRPHGHAAARPGGSRLQVELAPRLFAPLTKSDRVGVCARWWTERSSPRRRSTRSPMCRAATSSAGSGTRYCPGSPEGAPHATAARLARRAAAAARGGAHLPA